MKVGIFCMISLEWEELGPGLAVGSVNLTSEAGRAPCALASIYFQK